MIIDISDDKDLITLMGEAPHEVQTVRNSLTAEIPNAYMLKKLKSVKNTKRTFMTDYNQCPTGLWLEVIKICKKWNFNVSFTPLMQDYINQYNLGYNLFKNYVDKTFEGAVNEKGYPFKPYDYQIEAAYKLIKFQKCCGEISTSAGKTLISFIMFKYLFDVAKVKKILYVVPSIDLATQSAEKYELYESYLKKHNHNWSVGILTSGLKKKEKERVEKCNILFGTFQSLCKKNDEFYYDFNACFNDECLDKDTMVLMADGTEKKISDVKEGEKVYTYNRLTNEKEIHEVEYVYHGLSKGEKLYSLEMEDGTTLKITGNHKVLTQRGWVRVDELNCDDNTRIKNITEIGVADEEVYNLRIVDDHEECHNYFANGLCVSNCHHSSNKSVRNVLSKCRNLIYSIGLTGTFPKEGSFDNFTIQSCIGPVVYKFTANQLINEEKRGTPIYVDIQYLSWATQEQKQTLWLQRLNKNDDINAGTRNLKFEQDMVNTSYTRLKYICDMAIKTKKNALILFGQVKDGYGLRIFDYIKENSDKFVYYCDGNTPSANREWMKEQMENDLDGNTIMVASIGTMGEGIDLKNLWCIFLVNTTKSERMIRQICGRGLRMMEGKTKVVLIDFVDDLRYTENGHFGDNYMIKHGRDRKKIYVEQNFPVYEEKISFDV